MDTLYTIIKNGLKENSKKLKNSLLSLESTKEIMQNNKNFDFDIDLSFDKDANSKYDFHALYIRYTFQKDEQKIYIEFKMNDTLFAWNSTRISATLLDYAVSYFKNEDFKVNIGSYDGDDFVGIKEYINDFYDENEESKLTIYDYLKDDFIILGV